YRGCWFYYASASLLYLVSAYRVARFGQAVNGRLSRVKVSVVLDAFSNWDAPDSARRAPGYPRVADGAPAPRDCGRPAARRPARPATRVSRDWWPGCSRPPGPPWDSPPAGRPRRSSRPRPGEDRG